MMEKVSSAAFYSEVLDHLSKTVFLEGVDEWGVLRTQTLWGAHKVALL
jgi:hypothetical protein